MFRGCTNAISLDLNAEQAGGGAAGLLYPEPEHGSFLEPLLEPHDQHLRRK